MDSGNSPRWPRSPNPEQKGCRELSPTYLLRLKRRFFRRRCSADGFGRRLSACQNNCSGRRVACRNL